MSLNDPQKEIEVLLEKLAGINRSVQSAAGPDALQRDLAKQYLRQAYEIIDRWSPAAPSPPVSDPVEHLPKQAESKPEPIKQETAPVAVKKEEPVVLVKEAPPQQETIVIASPVKETSNEVKKVNGPVSLGEKFQSETKTTELNRKKVTGKSLREIIPLNEKFMFIIEFFDNSISNYEATIKQLDAFTNKTQVLDHMQNNAWTPEIMEKQQELIDRFIQIIDLKYED
jgi:hypothetical protein